MMNKILREGNLEFDFTACGTAERFDVEEINPYGMKAVDFVVEADDSLYFMEVKDYQHPNATLERRKEDYKTLVDTANGKAGLFNLEMGMKIKDSLLRRYAEGGTFTKKVMYLLFINLDKLGEFERGLLKEKICGYVPTGLNSARFSAFVGISFDLVNAKQLEKRGIICTEISKTKL
jgi:hypothetical protein